MSRYTKERMNDHRMRIKSLLVRNSELGILKVQKLLEDDDTTPLHLSAEYIGKLMKKLRKEKTLRFAQKNIEKYLAGFEDEMGEIKNELWNIIKDETSTKSERTVAIRELKGLLKDLFDKRFEAGVHDKKTLGITVNNTLVQFANEITNEISPGKKRRLIKELKELDEEEDDKTDS